MTKVTHAETQNNTLVCKGKLVLIWNPCSKKDKAKYTLSHPIENKYAEPIIISRAEVWEKGDKIYTSNIPIEIVKEVIPYSEHLGYETLTYVEGNGNQYKPCEIFGKIIALPENFSPEILKDIVEDRLKDGQSVFVECYPEMSEGWIPSYNNPDNSGSDIPSEPTGNYFIKLNKDNHITILPGKKEEDRLTFEEAIQKLINQYSMENGSDTPDFILAKYLYGCLENFNHTVRAREERNGIKRNGLLTKINA